MRLADKVRAVQVLRAAGMLDLSRPVLTAGSSLAMRRLGPIAGAARIATRRSPGDLALIDELGGLTYGELDRRANALARGWSAAGLEPGQVIGLLCRDHRGAVDSMIACGKLGVRLVLLNTGFSRIQLADVARREGLSALVHDEEFADLLSAVPAVVRRFVAWGKRKRPGGDDRRERRQSPEVAPAASRPGVADRRHNRYPERRAPAGALAVDGRAIPRPAGALLPTDLGNRTMAAFGPVLHNLYGSTECAVATVAMPDDWLAAPGTAGRTPVGCHIRLYDEADRPVTRPDTTGRIFPARPPARSTAPPRR